MHTCPPIEMPSEIAVVLDAQRQGLAMEVGQAIASLGRPCVYVTSSRVSENPLRRSALSRLWGKQEAAPTLLVTASKFGGTPYAETQENWKDHRFLGQIDLAEASSLCPDHSLSGLIRIDHEFDSGACCRATWFPDPDASKAVAQNNCRSTSRWECKIDFSAGWSLPHTDQDWFSLLPKDSPEYDSLWDMWNDWLPKGFDKEKTDNHHSMFAWPSACLEDMQELTDPIANAPSDLSEYEVLLRLSHDHQAGFQWGTNWIYCLVPRSGLLVGDLSQVTVVTGNW